MNKTIKITLTVLAILAILVSLTANVYYFVIQGFKNNAKAGFQTCVNQIVDSLNKTGSVNINGKVLVPVTQPTPQPESTK